MARRGRWLWFFGLLLVLAAVAVVAPIVYNLRLQLTPEQLAQAKARWEANGPADYDLKVVERLGDNPPGDELHVLVRGGKVVEVLRRGNAVPAEELSEAERQALSVPGLFRQIEARLEEDRAAPRRNFATAFFDRRTGYPVRYIHRVRGTRQRLEWNVKLLPVEPRDSPPRSGPRGSAPGFRRLHPGLYSSHPQGVREREALRGWFGE